MGVCVPRLIAVRAGPGRFNLAYELPHQTFLIEPSADMPQVLKRRIMKSLEKLHKKGVCHHALSLDNILIGGDGTVYFYDFHHARYIAKQSAVQLKEARDIDFALEKRKLEFQLDYENAREKEKHRLSTAIQTQRKNDIELRKQKTDPLYDPKLIIMPDTVPPLVLPRFESWVRNLEREPRRFIMPGQDVEDFEWELKRFYNILQRMEDLDSAAGLTQPPMGAAAVEMEPLTFDEEMVDLDEDMEKDSLLASNERYQSLKRKRTTEMEEPSSSQPPVKKRFRRGSQLTFGCSSTQKSRQFKNEDLRPGKSPEVFGLFTNRPLSGVKLVGSHEVEPSIQENNVVPLWPIVVVRDFQQQPRPKIGAAMEALVKRNFDKFKEDRDRETIKHEVEQKTSSSSWFSLWNPWRYLSWGSQGDEGKQDKDEKSRGAMVPPHLSYLTD